MKEHTKPEMLQVFKLAKVLSFPVRFSKYTTESKVAFKFVKTL
jgi:hypothetical protein